jgi:hypothetical protein
MSELEGATRPNREQSYCFMSFLRKIMIRNNPHSSKTCDLFGGSGKECSQKKVRSIVSNSQLTKKFTREKVRKIRVVRYGR